MIYFLIVSFVANIFFIIYFIFNKNNNNLLKEKNNLLQEKLKNEFEKNAILQKALDEIKAYKEIKNIVEETKQNKKNIEAANALFANTPFYNYSKVITTSMSDKDADNLKSDLNKVKGDFDKTYEDLSNMIEGFKVKK